MAGAARPVAGRFATSFEAGEPLSPPQPAGTSPVLDVGPGPSDAPSDAPGLGATGARCVRARWSGGAGEARLLDVGVLVGPDTWFGYTVFVPAAGPAAAICLDLAFDDGTTLAALDARDAHGTPLTPGAQAAARILRPRQWNRVECHVGALAAGRTVVAVLVRVGDAGWAGGPDEADAPRPAGGPDVPDAATRPGGATRPYVATRAGATGEWGAADSAPRTAWVDDVEIAPRPDDHPDPVDLVDTRRGSRSAPGLSRGNTFPAAALPNGATLLSPMTAPRQDWFYRWSGHPRGQPALHGMVLSHQPSPWMGDRNQLVVGAWWSAAGEPGVVAHAFRHDEETARPYRYTVRLDGGPLVDAAPVAHGAVVRLTAPGGGAGQETLPAAPAGVGDTHAAAQATGTAGPDAPAPARRVGGALRLSLGTVGGVCRTDVDGPAGRVRGWLESGSRLSVGRSRLYFAVEVDVPFTDVGEVDGRRVLDLGAAPVVTVRVATSLIGADQAIANLAAEIGAAGVDEVAARARAAWAERLGVLEIGGASRDELVTAYSCLYRVNLYPSVPTELVPGPDGPRPAYASPVLPARSPSTPRHTGAAVVAGSIAVNQGFWDTYRTVWPLYALAYPVVAASLADGFVEHFRTAGWISRWSSPGFADLMTGTSSDVAFADLDAKGVPLPERVAAYRAGLRNATAFPQNAAVGRKDLAETAYRCAVSPATGEAVSWAFEGSVNDHALAAMAERLAAAPGVTEREAARYRDEATYLRGRCDAWAALYDPATGFFRSRWRDGSFRSAPGGYDPREWGGDYTEADGWAYAFPAPHDPAGLATLLGGREELRTRLDAFFATPEDGTRPGGYPADMHELVEAAQLGTGQFAVSNQPVHHIPFLYAFTDTPWRTSEVVHDVLHRLFRGSEIGQGYPGDEDNGEMSAWYLFAASGLYPLQVGTPRYTLHAPAFDRMTWHLPGGDLVVRAHRGSPGDRHVRRVRVDGVDHQATWVEHGRLAGGATIDVELGPEPSAWGTSPASDPPSLHRPGDPPRPWRDVSGRGTLRLAGRGRWRRGAGVLADDERRGRRRLRAGEALVWASDGPGETVELYTLTSSGDPPGAATWRLEGSAAGGPWTVLDRRQDEGFDWPDQIRPFALPRPGRYDRYRLVLEAAPARGLWLSQVELLTR